MHHHALPSSLLSSDESQCSAFPVFLTEREELKPEEHPGLRSLLEVTTFRVRGMAETEV